MGKYNEIGVGRFNRAIQKLLSMKGDAVMAQLASDLQMVMVYPWGVENRYLESWDRFAFAVKPLPQPGVLSAARVRNPKGSDIIAVFEKLTVSSAGGAAADGYFLQKSATNLDLDFAVLTTNLGLDPRGRPAPTMIASRSSGGAAPSLAVRQEGVLLAVQNYEFIQMHDQQIALLPGEAIQIQADVAVNQGMTCTFMWRERFLEDSERT